MQIEELVEFVTLAKVLNYRKAADCLFMSPSTLSKRISGLESKLGVTLFERSTSSVQITEDGERMYLKAVRVVDAYNDLLSQVGREQGNRLRVAVPLRYPAFSAPVAEALRSLRAEYPHIDCHIVDSGLRDDVFFHLSRGCDAVLATAMPEYGLGRLSCAHLASMRASVWVSEESELAERGVVSVRDLEGMIYRPVSDDADEPWTRFIMGSLARKGIVPMMGESVDDQYQLRRNDYAIVCAASPSASFGLGAKQLPLDEEITATIAVVHNRNRETQALLAFISMLESAFAASGQS